MFDAKIAAAFGLAQGDIVVSIHCGSRGLGHQIGTEFLQAHGGGRGAARHRACPTASWPARRSTPTLGQAYLGAMRAAINCALANRQILTHLVREVFAAMLPQARLPLLYDVSHNTCKVEEHRARRRHAQALRAPQGRDARLRPGASRPAGGVARRAASRC